MNTQHPKTVLELITQSAAQDDIGQGTEASVYNIADPRFPELVLRIFDDGSLENLSLTTSLTPVDYGYGKRPLAPSILQGGGVAFHLRQDGVSLTRLWKRYAETMGSQEAYARVLEQIADLPDKAYESLLDNMNYLTSIRRSIESRGDNIMLSDTALSWVDIGRNVRENYLTNVRSMLFNFNINGKPDAVTKFDVSERISKARLVIDTKLERAAEKTGTPRNEKELDNILKMTNNIFSSVKSIDVLSQIPLSASPTQLREALNAIEKHLGVGNFGK